MEENIGKVTVPVYAAELGGLDQRSHDGPVLRAVIVAGEECVLARKNLRAHRAFDDVGIEIDAAVIEEAGQALPVLERMVEDFRRRHKEGLAPDGAAFFAEMKEIEDRYRQTNPSADDLTDAMDEPSRKIMASPTFTLAGLAVKARATAFACSHFYRVELHDADWDHQHVRTLIDGVLAMAGQPPIVMPYAKRPSPVDPALAVAIRYLDAEKAYGKALERRQHDERLTDQDCSDDAILDAVDAAMDAADDAPASALPYGANICPRCRGLARRSGT